jgi:predicted peptidase
MLRIHTTLFSLLLLACLSIASAVSAQRHMDSIKVSVTPWAKAGALVYLPDDYNKTKKDYPMILFLHGKSKSGNNLQKLLLEGIPYWINNGEKIEATNPVDGKLYKFIVIAPQAPSWGLKPNEVQRVLDDVEKRYRIDRSRIYITGYSAGGWATVMALTDHPALTARFAAAVPMSVATIDEPNKKRFKMVADANVPCWYLAGMDEPHFLEECEAYKDSTNTYKPNLARLTPLEGFAHHSWKELYDVNTKKYEGMSIYEWMLQYQRPNKN